MKTKLKSWRKRLIPAVVCFAVVAFVFGSDIWDFFSDRRENTRLRSDACERMATLGFILPESHDLCSAYNSIYYDGLAAAVLSQTPRIQAKVTKEIELISAVTAEIDTSLFSTISFENLLEFYSNTKFPAQQTISKAHPEMLVLDAPWVMITGYGDLRVERPKRNGENSRNTGVVLSLDRTLRDLSGGMLNVICKRTTAVSLGCRGTVFIIVSEGVLSPTFTVVGMQLEPIKPEQLFWTSLDTLLPPFVDGTIKTQNFYMHRFLDTFPELPEAHIDPVSGTGLEDTPG